MLKNDNNNKKIDVLLQFFNKKIVRETYLKFVLDSIETTQIRTSNLVSDYLFLWEEKQEEIKVFWKLHPYLRLSQVLIHYNIIPNLSGFWFYKEDVDFLVENSFCEYEDLV